MEVSNVCDRTIPAKIPTEILLMSGETNFESLQIEFSNSMNLLFLDTTSTDIFQSKTFLTFLG